MQSDSHFHQARVHALHMRGWLSSRISTQLRTIPFLNNF